MKLGILSPLPKNGDISTWCPYDNLEPDDYVPICGYLGSCPNCPDGSIKLPEVFLASYIRDTDDKIHHVFQTIEEIRCAGCGAIVDRVSLICPSNRSGLDVTSEFISYT